MGGFAQSHTDHQEQNQVYLPPGTECFFMTPIFKEGEIKSEMSSRSEAGAFPSLLMDPAVRQVLLEPPARYLREPHEQLYEARTITVPILRMRKKRVRKLATCSEVTRIKSVHGAKSVQARPS